MSSPSAFSSTRQRLDVYRKRRDFKATPEPAPKAADKSSGDRFVIQLHHASHRHFDFRLQVGGALRSWAVPKGPSLDPKQKRLAVEVEDHPLEYGKFQGSIPEGHYGAGDVWIWDEGRWAPEGDAAKALKEGHLDFELFGSRMKGHWSLIRTSMSGKRPQWLLFKRSDEHVKKGDVADDTPLDQWKGATPRRAATAQKSAKAARSAFPAEVGLQLAKLVEKAPEGADWLHEVKYDGYRVLLMRNGRKLQIRSRGGLEWSAKLPQLKKAVLALPCKNCILDGEVVALDEQGRSRFDLLQRDFGEPQAAGNLVAMLFDLLHLDGQDWRPLPQELRKEALQKLLQGSDDCLRLSEYLEGHGAKAAKAACSAGLEGIISKDRKAPYREGRGGSWVKTKCVDADEFAIVGYTRGQRSREKLGALLLAEPAGQDWRYVGRVGSGFTEALIQDLLERMRPAQQAVKLLNPPTRADLRGARPVWVKPALVLEVEHRGRTGENLLRQASLKGLRADKSITDLRQPDRAPRVPAQGDASMKQVTTRRSAKADAEPGSAVRLTHPERRLFEDPVITKRELADFYSEIAEWILPELQRRPLALLRCPDGAGKTCFFQKRATPGFPDSVHQARGEPYLWIEDVGGLIGMVQMGVLELHAWGATVDDIEHPDRVVFDLDPGEGVEWRRVIAAARLLRERLEQLGLQSFVRSSGGKGLHVVLPLQPQAGWDTVKNFSHALAQMLAEEQPDEFIATASKARRKGRIYIDYLRNGCGATAVASYTLRARPGAPAAVPLDWGELSRLKSPAQFGYANLRQRLKRLKRDPWEGFRDLNQRLPKLH